MPNPNYITGTVTVSGGLLPAEKIRPAPGVMGVVIVTNAGANAATLTAPGSAAGITLPATSQPVPMYLGGVQLTVTGTSPQVTYGFATGG